MQAGGAWDGMAAWLVSALGLDSREGSAQVQGSTPDGFPCTCSNGGSGASHAALTPVGQDTGLGAVAVPEQLRFWTLEELRAQFDPARDPRYIDIGKFDCSFMLLNGLLWHRAHA